MKCEVTIITALVAATSASVYDCWDAEKMARMSFKTTKEEAADPGLFQFSKMLKCLAAQGGNSGFGSASGGPGGSGTWNQWNSVANTGQFVPNWNVQQGGGGGRGVGAGGSGPIGMGKQPDWRTPGWPGAGGQQHQQPLPGVHPDDYGTRGMMKPQRPWQPGNQPPTVIAGADAAESGIWGKEKKISGGDLDDGGGRRRRPSSRNRRPPPEKGGNKRRNDDHSTLAPPQPPPLVEVPTWQDPIDQPPLRQPSDGYMVHMNPEETAAVSLSRKYGYAIMALSVVVLAVLMVATIFCCNSSNSTMSQAATAALPVANQYDTYSIYSYKGVNPTMAADTLRSTGTLHTETMKSSRSITSPQYRVSDIDPEYARRYKDNQQQFA